MDTKYSSCTENKSIHPPCDTLETHRVTFPQSDDLPLVYVPPCPPLATPLNTDFVAFPPCDDLPVVDVAGQVHAPIVELSRVVPKRESSRFFDIVLFFSSPTKWTNLLEFLRTPWTLTGALVFGSSPIVVKIVFLRGPTTMADILACEERTSCQEARNS